MRQVFLALLVALTVLGCATRGKFGAVEIDFAIGDASVSTCGEETETSGGTLSDTFRAVLGTALGLLGRSLPLP